MTARLIARAATAIVALGVVAACVPAGVAGASAHHRHTAGSTRGISPQTLAARQDGVNATLAFNQTVGAAVLGFASDLQDLSGALAAGDLPEAKADELAAQGRYDVFRLLSGSSPTAASAIDGLAADVPEGQQFAGLHLVEEDLWDGGNATSAVSALLAEAPLVEESFLRLRESPETIVTIAARELGWVNEVAIPGKEEVYSRLDSVDVAATVDGAHAAYMDVLPLARLVEPGRAETVAHRFSALLDAVQALGAPGTVTDGTIPPAEWEAVAQDDDAAAAALAALEPALVGYGPRQIYGYSS